MTRHLPIAMLILLAGCEPDTRYTADTPELQAAIIEQVGYLETTFDIGVGSIHGKIAGLHGHRESGVHFWSEHWGWVRGLWLADERAIMVSSRWDASDVRHEAMHAAGYQHSDREINGVRVSDHVADWRDIR